MSNSSASASEDRGSAAERRIGEGAFYGPASYDRWCGGDIRVTCDEPPLTGTNRASRLLNGRGWTDHVRGVPGGDTLSAPELTHVDRPQAAAVRRGDEHAVAWMDDEVHDVDRRQVAAEHVPSRPAIRRHVHAE